MELSLQILCHCVDQEKIVEVPEGLLVIDPEGDTWRNRGHQIYSFSSLTLCKHCACVGVAKGIHRSPKGIDLGSSIGRSIVVSSI
jgi:hypothetical protein